MIGRVVELSPTEVVVEAGENQTRITVEPASWESVEYKLNAISGEIEESVKGTYTQIPLKCAWAITIHKSQGLSFDRAIIDAGGSFAYGQVYVALSRCRTFEGMVLRTPIQRSAIIGDTLVENFNTTVTNSEPSRDELSGYQRQYFATLLCELFDFDNFNRLGYTISKLINSALYTQYPKLADALRELVAVSNPQLKSVGASFQQQLRKAIATSEEHTTDSYIKERLERASEYFLHQLTPFRILAEEISTIKPDAKEIAKRLKSNFEEFSTELSLKEEALRLCAEGFTVEEYLRTKASVLTRGAVKAPKIAKERVVQRITSDIINVELYETLVAWRLDLARSEGVAAYQILTNRTILEIQASLPTTIERLKKVNGIGDMKLHKYGDQLVEMVREYSLYSAIDVDDYHAKGVGIEESIEPPKEPKPKKSRKAEPKEPKIDSFMITLQLYNEGETIEQIAQLRSLTHQTIEVHLTKCISLGHLELEDVLEASTIAKVRSAIDSGLARQKEIFEYLGEAVSYGEIRMVCAKYLPQKDGEESK